MRSLAVIVGVLNKEVLKNLTSLNTPYLEEFSLSGREKAIKKEDLLKEREGSKRKLYSLVVSPTSGFFEKLVNCLSPFPLKKLVIASSLFIDPDTRIVRSRIKEFEENILKVSFPHLEVLDVPIIQRESLEGILMQCPKLREVQVYYLFDEFDEKSTELWALAALVISKRQISNVAINSNVIFPWLMRNKNVKKSDTNPAWSALWKNENLVESHLFSVTKALQLYGKKVFLQVDKPYRETYEKTLEQILGDSQSGRGDIPAVFSTRYGSVNWWDPKVRFKNMPMASRFFKGVKKNSSN